MKIDYTLPDKTMTRDEILKWLQEVESDERLFYKTATIFENAPLAFIQTELEVTSQVLRKVLNINPLNLNKLRKKEK